MFGLCMPTGEIWLEFKDGQTISIEMTDEVSPKKHILEDKNILQWVKKYGYENINRIIYKRNNFVTAVSMAEYYYENASKLEEVK